MALLVFAANIHGAADVNAGDARKTITRLALRAIVTGEDGPPFNTNVSQRLVELANDIATGKYPGLEFSVDEGFGLMPDGTLPEE
jgi:hypothetical protein